MDVLLSLRRVWSDIFWLNYLYARALATDFGNPAPPYVPSHKKYTEFIAITSL